MFRALLAKTPAGEVNQPGVCLGLALADGRGLGAKLGVMWAGVEKNNLRVLGLGPKALPS